MLARRSFVNVLLALCLLWSQQAALAHAISHIPAPTESQGAAAAYAQASHDRGAETSDFCLDCLAYAQVTTAAAGAAAAADVATAAVAIDASAAYGRHCTQLLSFHARGPPALL